MDKEVEQPLDLLQIVAWFHENRKRVTTIVVVILAIAALGGIYSWHKSYNETAANDALSDVKPPTTPQEAASASSATPYLRVADEYAGTQAAARALLMGGGILFEAGKFDQAKAAFDRFMGEYSESPLADQALIGVAACLEAQGKNAEAISRYEDMVKRHPNDPTTPQARSALARCYVAVNKPDLALRIYVDLARANNNDTWTAEAKSQIAELIAKYPALAKPAAPAPAPAAAPTMTLPTVK